MKGVKKRNRNKKKKRKDYKKPLNPRMKRVVKVWVGKGGPLSDAIRTQYAEATVGSGKIQKAIRESDEWNDLLETYLPDEELMEHHKELLNAVEIEHYIFPKKESDDSIHRTIEEFGFKVLKIQTQGNWKRVYFPILNARAKKDALDMAYKLKKKYDNTLEIKHGLANTTDEEIDRELAGVIAAISKGLNVAERKGAKKGK